MQFREEYENREGVNYLLKHRRSLRMWDLGTLQIVTSAFDLNVRGSRSVLIARLERVYQDLKNRGF
jgi:hypothetical protein